MALKDLAGFVVLILLSLGGVRYHYQDHNAGDVCVFTAFLVLLCLFTVFDTKNNLGE